MMALDLRSVINSGDSEDDVDDKSGKSDFPLNESETERRVRQKGLKSVSNPEVITFREQSEWLDKLVTEELKGQQIKREKGL